MFHVHLKGMCILLFLDVMSWIYQLSLTVLFCHLGSLLFYWFFCLEDLSIDTSGVLKSPTIIVFLSVSPFMSVSMFYIFWCSYVGCIYVDKYNILSLYRSFYHYIVSFVIFVLKSILSDMSIVTLAFLSFLFARKIFFHALIFNLCVSFALKWVSCRQHVVGSCFLLSNVPLCVFWLKVLIH